MPRSEHSADTSVHSFTTEDTATSSELASRRPKKYKWHKRFAYQKFKGWRPILNPRGAELFFLSCGVLLLALGIPILIASLNVVEYRVPYAFDGPFAGISSDQRQQLLWSTPGDDGVQYDVHVLIDKRMEPPIWVSFELGTYFQNFRRYVRSFDPKRMHEGGDSGSPLSACNPFGYMNGNSSAPINPCGQIAHSYFNDTFQLSIAGGGGARTVVPLDDTDIAWSSDANHLYGDVPAVNYNLVRDLRGGNTTSVNLNKAQHWMVWMRPSSHVEAKKLYGRIDTPLEEGTNLTVTINNRYNTYGFEGAKTVIISTNSWVGGKNVFLGACYLAVGGLCLLTALFFFVGYDLGVIWKRKYGDMANVSWLRQHAAEVHTLQQFVAAGSTNGADGVTVEPIQDGDASDNSPATTPPSARTKNW